MLRRYVCTLLPCCCETEDDAGAAETTMGEVGTAGIASTAAVAVPVLWR